MIPRRSAEPTPLTPVELRPFGQTGLHVSALGFGGANIGFTDISDKTLDRMFGAAVELGVNLIDTAAMYGDSEEKIGRALHGRRQQYLICTKCGRCLPPRRSPNGFFMRLQRKFRRSRGLPEEYESLDWHPRVIEWSIHRSLRRLKTDHIDLLLLHSCSEETLQKEEVLGVLHRARKSGKVRFIGYSGDGPAALYAIQSGQFQAVEISINIADQDGIDTVLPLATQKGMGVIAKRPLANNLWKSTQRPDPVRFPHLQVYWERLRQLGYDFLQSDRASEIGLRFTLSVPGAHTAIPGTTNPEHLFENARYAAEGPLPGDQFEAIRSTWSKISKPSWIGQT
jgi:aryl-alcohol dehydrogenase-like predicted oxidoreductase